MFSKTKKVTISHEKTVETEIQKLLDQDFIRPVKNCVLKNGHARLCVEMRKASTAITRSYYPIPT